VYAMNVSLSFQFLIENVLKELYRTWFRAMQMKMLWNWLQIQKE